MFDLRKGYGFSRILAESGAKMVVGADPENDYVLLRKMPNDKYRTKMSSVMMANRKILEVLKVQDPEAHDKRDTELMCEVLAETVLIGWGKGFGDAGKPLTYSVEEAKRVLVEYPEFRGDCIAFASSNANYPLEIDVEEVKKK